MANPHLIRRRSPIALYFLVCFFSSFSIAGDLGVPDYQKLITRSGFDFFHSDENFNNAGYRENLHLGNQLTSLSQDTFWIEGEYGIADHWGASAHLSFVHDYLDTQTGSGPLLVGNGIPEITSRLNWNVIDGNTALTLEGIVTIPFFSPTSATNLNTLVVGNGSTNTGLIVHFYQRAGFMVFSLSPGLVVRFNGYSSLFTANAEALMRLKRVYASLFFDGVVALTTQPFLDSSYQVHDAPGAGGSYAFLSGSPVGVVGGAKVGIKIYKEITFEGRFSQAMGGYRYPDFFQVGANISMLFDFYVPEKKIPVHEVPLNDDSTPAPPE